MSTGKIMITEEQVRTRAAELGAQIVSDYDGCELVLVGVLKGAVVWMADVMKAVDKDVTIDFVQASSYGSSKESSGVVKIKKDIDTDISGKHVIIVEDIVDTGNTLSYLASEFASRGASSVEICALLDKPTGRKVPLDVKYAGFEVGDQFIIGYGLDFDEKYRNLPYVSYLED